MSLLHVLEGEVRSGEDWTDRLRISAKEVEELIASKILRPHDEKLRLTFVGLIAYASHAVYCRPKFAKDIGFSLQQTIVTLERYFGTGGSRKSVVDSIRYPEFPNRSALRELDVAHELDAWFKSHGVYRQEHQRLGNSGRTHWPRTIASQQPLHVQGSTIYPQPVAVRREGILNEVTALQMGVTRTLVEKYELPAVGGLRHAELAAGPLIGEWPLGETDSAYYLRRLDVERRTIFRSDTLRLLSTLRSALTVTLGRSSQPRIFGTTAFYAVWEDACRSLFKSHACLLPMTNPTWTVPNTGRGVTTIEHEQIPDLIFSSESFVYIADAKYYWPFPAARPGMSDIVKQLYYAETTESKKSIRSLFFLPNTQGQKPVLLGCTRVASAMRTFPPIEAWGLDPILMLTGYACGSFEALGDVIGVLDRGSFQVTEMISETPASV